MTPHQANEPSISCRTREPSLDQGIFGAMQRYFFHICNGDGFTQDDQGKPLASLEAARAEAIRMARSIMSDELQSGQMNLASFIEIEDEAGKLLVTVTFPEAIEIRTTRPPG